MTEPPNSPLPETIQSISARATTIQERLERRASIVQEEIYSQGASQSFLLWRRLATNDSESTTTALLRDLGHSPESIMPLFGRVSFPPQSPPPVWTQDLEWVIRSFTAQHTRPLSRFIYPDEPIPFEDILETLVHSSSKELTKIAGASLGIISEVAFADMQRHLLELLSNLLSPTLIVGFEHFRLMNQPLSSILFIPGSQTSTKQYEAYIEFLRESEMLRLLTDKPVLCRLIATTMRQWIRTNQLFISRLSQDWNDIAVHFDMQTPHLPVQRLGCGLSDQHNNGQTVYKVQFNKGRLLLYKPKPLGLDAAWRGLLEWLSTNGLAPLPLAPDVLPRGAYGWTEYLQPESCTENETKAFFQRAGALLCLVYLLQGTDCHFENIVACGEYPALVDLETLLHPWIKESAASTSGSHKALLKAKRRIQDSVLATGYLPAWTVIPGGQLTGEGGLSPKEERITRARVIRFINTDGMMLEEVQNSTSNQHARETVSSESLARHTVDILHGFNRTFDFFLQNKQAICDDSGPLHYFKGKISRLLLRPTRLYSFLLNRSLQPHHLEDGIIWGANFDFLYRLTDDRSIDNTLKCVIDAERRALQNLDIPLFWVATDSTDIHFSEGTIANAIEKPSWLQTLERAQSLSERQRVEQLDMIRYALNDLGSHPLPNSLGPPQPEGTALFSSEMATAYANSVFAILNDSAIRCGGGATWIGGVPLSWNHKYQLEVLGFDLYSGAIGVALFLGALFKVTGSPEAKALALEALDPFRSDIRHNDNGRRLAYTMGIGGGAGLGSAAYTLGLLSGFLNEEGLLEDAQRAAELISIDRILEDKDFDVIQGSAGSILGLVSLYSICHDKRLLRSAIQCGELLVSKATSQFAGKAWASPLSNVPLTGFSHGVAGISLALTRLYSATGDHRYLALSLEGIEYERGTFSPSHQNWPDFRASQRDPDYLSFWCHGAAGIGLARLGMLRALPDDPNIRLEIEIALRTTIEAPPVQTDHLCCGNLGRIEFLFAAGTRLNLPSLVQLAKQRAAQFLCRQLTCDSPSWPAGRAKENPGFFSGISGTGYEVLRLDQPDILPSILLWENNEGWA